MSRPTSRDLEILPRDAEGPVFSEPWQARIFGIVVHLCEVRGIPWKEWADRFSAELADAARPESARDPADYYARWLDACEAWLAERGLAPSDELALVREAIAREQRDAHEGHEHASFPRGSR